MNCKMLPSVWTIQSYSRPRSRSFHRGSLAVVWGLICLNLPPPLLSDQNHFFTHLLFSNIYSKIFCLKYFIVKYSILKYRYLRYFIVKICAPRISNALGSEYLFHTLIVFIYLLLKYSIVKYLLPPIVH